MSHDTSSIAHDTVTKLSFIVVQLLLTPAHPDAEAGPRLTCRPSGRRCLAAQDQVEALPTRDDRHRGPVRA